MRPGPSPEQPARPPSSRIVARGTGPSRETFCADVIEAGSGCYRPCHIEEDKIIKKWWFQHIVHDVRHVTLIVNLFRLIQGKKRTWHCGSHTLINSQETCFVSGLATARQLGADYPFDDPEAKRSFNYYGSIMYGSGFRSARD